MSSSSTRYSSKPGPRNAPSIKAVVRGVADPLHDPRLARLVVALRAYRGIDAVALYAADRDWRIVIESGEPAYFRRFERMSSTLKCSQPTISTTSLPAIGCWPTSSHASPKSGEPAARCSSAGGRADPHDTCVHTGPAYGVAASIDSDKMWDVVIGT